MSERIQRDYDRVGLMKYFGGLAADRLTADAMLADLGSGANVGIGASLVA